MTWAHSHSAGWIWRVRSGRWKQIELIERKPTEIEQAGGVPV